MKLLATMALAAAAFATCAQAGSPKRFDLICNGGGVDGAVNGKAFEFAERIRVDTVKGRFCTDDFCGAFTTATLTHFEYECKADDGFCHPESIKSAGDRHVKYEHFSFDWGSKAYKRTIEGVRGDPVSGPFRLDYTGVCTFGAFSGLHAKE